MRVAAISWPRVELYPAKGLVRLAGPLSCRLADDRIVLAPGGFYSDLASVPRFAWGALESTPARLSVMGILHDYAVRVGAKLHHPNGDAEPFTVEAATDLAVEVARYYGVPAADRWVIGAGLFIAQGTYWQRREVLWTPAQGEG